MVQRLLKFSVHFRPARWDGSSAFDMTVLPLFAHVRLVADAVQAHDQRVAGHRAFDEEGPRLRIAAGRPPFVLRVGPAGVHAPGLDRVTRRDAEHRRQRAT